MKDAAPTPTRLGKRLHEARVAAGLTQQQLADEIKLGQTGVQAWEAGRTAAPSAKTLGAVAKVLGLDFGELLDLIDQDSRERKQAARTEQLLDSDERVA